MSKWRLLSEHKLTKIRKVALRRIERELDLARFIRDQMKMTAIIKALTTKAERNYLKHNYRFMLEMKKNYRQHLNQNRKGTRPMILLLNLR